MKLKNQDKDIFSQIGSYWSQIVNGEIWLQDKNLERGSPDYFDQIARGRFHYNYYAPDILSWLQGGTGNKLIEVGCGLGTDSAWFVQHGFSATCVDLAEEHVRLAKMYFKHKGLAADIRTGNAEDLDFPGGSFHCAYSFGVLHHTRNPQKAINEIHRVLVPGGRAAVMLYHRHSLNNLVHRLFRIPYDNVNERRPGGSDAHYVYRYSRSEARHMFRAFSRVQVRVEYVYGAGWEPVTRLTPRFLYRLLSKTVGWHLLILAEKQ